MANVCLLPCFDIWATHVAHGLLDEFDAQRLVIECDTEDIGTMTFIPPLFL